MRVLDTSLWLYRKTVKRIRPVHSAIHRVLDKLLIPGLERATDFQTIAEDPFGFALSC